MIGDEPLFITIRIDAVCNPLSPAFSRLLFTTRRLSMDPGFFNDDIALPATSGQISAAMSFILRYRINYLHTNDMKRRAE
jgi:hypothetical protein